MTDNPSMRIDQVTGVFNCFSCEFKGNFFHILVKKLNRMEIKRQMLKKKIKQVRELKLWDYKCQKAICRTWVTGET